MNKAFSIIPASCLLMAMVINPITAGAAPPIPPDEVERMELPDLQPLPPYELQLELSHGGVQKHLRFSYAVWNRGPAALELHGWYDRYAGVVRVKQLLRKADGEYLDSQTGEFAFHSQHKHWHWMGFSRYEILSVLQDGSIGEQLVSNEKVGFCLRDDERMPAYLTEFPMDAGMVRQPRARYGECGWQKQGLSAGWLDIYGYKLHDQSLDVTGLADGLYLLRAEVDPAGLIVEVEKGNNRSQVYLGIYGDRLVTFGIDPPGSEIIAVKAVPAGAY